MLAVIAGLILIEPDLGTAFTLVVAVAVMVFAAGDQLALRRVGRAAGACRCSRRCC